MILDHECANNLVRVLLCANPTTRHVRPQNRRPLCRSVPDGSPHWRSCHHGPDDRCGCTRGNQCATPLNCRKIDLGQCHRRFGLIVSESVNLRSRLPVTALVLSPLTLNELTTLSCSTADATTAIPVPDSAWTFKRETDPESRPTITCGHKWTGHQLKIISVKKWNWESHTNADEAVMFKFGK